VQVLDAGTARQQARDVRGEGRRRVLLIGGGDGNLQLISKLSAEDVEKLRSRVEDTDAVAEPAVAAALNRRSEDLRSEMKRSLSNAGVPGCCAVGAAAPLAGCPRSQRTSEKVRSRRELNQSGYGGHPSQLMLMLAALGWCVRLLMVEPAS